MARTPKRSKDAETRAGRIEAIIGLVSAAMVLAILGVLLSEALGAGAGLPDLTVAEAASRPGDDAGQLRFEVLNRGERTAASVTVALSLRDGDAIAGDRRVLIDFVPSHGRASGAFLLAPDERGLDRDLTVESYLDP